MLLPECLTSLSQTDVYQHSSPVLMILFNLTSCLYCSLRNNFLTSRMTGSCHIVMPHIAACHCWTFQTHHLTAHFTQTRSAVVFKRLEFLPGFYKVWNTWLCGLKGKLCGKHICVETTEVITPGLSDTKNLCVSAALYCRVGLRHVLKSSVSLGLLLQGSNELWKFNGEIRNILMYYSVKHRHTHTQTHTHTIVETYYCRWKGLLKRGGFTTPETGRTCPPPHFPTLPSQMSFKTGHFWSCVHGQYERNTDR